MKNTNKIILLSAALGVALVGTIAVANPAGRDRPDRNPREHRMQADQMHAKQMHAMADYLGLTDEQKAGFKALQEKQHARLVTIHSDEKLMPEQRRTEARAVHASLEDERQALLTPAQKQKAEAMKAAVKERVQRRMKENMPKIAQHETQLFLKEQRQQKSHN